MRAPHRARGIGTCVRYIKQNYKYDIRFSDDDSSVVTYKEWNYFQPVQNSAHCKIMFFRMNKAKYSAQFADCPGRSCDCQDDTELITVVNAKFLSLVAKRTHHGMLAMLGQQVFETIEESFTARGKFLGRPPVQSRGGVWWGAGVSGRP